MKMKKGGNKVIRYILMFSIILLGLLFIRTTASAYTEEQINQAKAWLSAHGYSPTRAGAGQAMSDYENGKLKLGEKEQEIAEKSGIKVKGTDKASDKKTKKKSKKKTKKKTNEKTKNPANNETGNATKDTNMSNNAYSTDNPAATKQPSKDINNVTEASDEPVKESNTATASPLKEAAAETPANTKESVEAEKQEFPAAIMCTLGLIVVVCIILLCLKKRNK